MSQIKKYENEYVTLWFHPEKKIIHHQFHGFIHGEKLQELLMKGLELMKSKKADKWLSDDRKNSVFSPEDQAWGDKVWFPAVKAAGWKYWAMVLPTKAVGQLSMQGILKKYSDEGVTVQIFANPARALEWLEDLP